MNTLLLSLAFLLPAARADGPAAVLKPMAEAEFKPSGALPVGVEYHLIREDAKTGAVQALVRFPKNYALAAHSHDYEETLVLVKGKARIKLAGGTEKVLEPGDYAYLPAGAAHEVMTEGRKEAVMLLTTTGPFGVKPAE